MSFQNLGPSQSSSAADAFGKSDVGISYLRQVMAWMFLGLAITTGVAIYF
jgi:hypothetical protein